MGKGKSGSGAIMSVIRTPLGVVLLLVVILILAGLTAVSAISGELTAEQIYIAISVLNCGIWSFPGRVGYTLNHSRNPRQVVPLISRWHSP